MTSCCGGPSGKRGLERREFLKFTAAGSAGALFLPPPLAHQQERHPIPADKAIPREWGDLLAKESSRVLKGSVHDAVAMPVSGIGTGQLYLLPDGTLETWDVFNEHRFTGYGRDNYGRGLAKAGIAQGFGIVLDGAFRPLSKLGFADTAFRGKWPLGEVEYLDPDYPLAVRLEAFTPTIPLNARESGLPATVFRIRLENRSRRKLSGRLVAWLENAVCRKAAKRFAGVKTGLVQHDRERRTWLLLSAEPGQGNDRRPAIRIADFEGEDWGKWKVTGEAFGKGPVKGSLEDQQRVAGFEDRRLVNSFHGGDDTTGTLLSPPFELARRYVNVLVGGGNFPKEACVELLVDGEVRGQVTGEKTERLVWRSINVGPWQGKQGRIRIVDERKGAWGHVLCDTIELDDSPRDADDLRAQPDFGELALVLPWAVDAYDFDVRRHPEEPRAIAAEAPGPKGDFRPGGGRRRGITFESQALAASPITGLSAPFELGAGETRSFPVVLAWFLPNHPYGRYYANRFHSVRDVAGYVVENLPRLEKETRTFVDCYYESTLPAWLLDRVLWPMANLQTSLVQWRRGGRFWAWEGVGCCAGTCTHVWNYAHGMAALFPELERNVREFQDFGEGFDEKTGLVGFRSNRAYAADGQCGTILKAYREHLHSTDDAFLRRNWPRIRMAIEYLLKRDGNGDGLLEDSQHNTYDIEFHGPNTFVGALYLAALRAEEMAQRIGDRTFARALRLVFESGSKATMKRLWNGDYFVQEVDLKEHPKAQYGDGCLSDQLFGQNWAHELGLGYLYPREAVRKALRSVYRYNWATDVGVYNADHKPERVFARPGEPGLFTCTWPKSKFLPQGVRYKSEVWTGIEHQAASHMLREGLIQEGLHIIRGIEARYDGRKNNPYNEIECGDHYARALASWADLTGLMGYECDGPAGRYAFAPRVTADRFRAFFVGPEGWGSYWQSGDAQVTELREARITAVRGPACGIDLRHGTMRISELVLSGFPGRRPRAENARAERLADGRWRLRFEPAVVLDTASRKQLVIMFTS